MNILVIGNGFDLAHELPTKYIDFLFFCSIVKNIIKENKIEKKIPKVTKSYNKLLESNESIIFKEIDMRVFIINYNTNKRDKKVFRNMLNNFFRKVFSEKSINQKIMEEILCLVFNNFWIDYFLDNLMNQKENWIDFESEISNVIKSIDTDMKEKDFYGQIDDLSNKFLRKRFLYKEDNLIGSKKKQKITYQELRDILLNDLNRLIRALEIYLTEYVEKISCKVESIDIKSMLGIKK